MQSGRTASNGIDRYVSGFPKDVQGILGKVRRTIRAAAPDARETMSYQIPTFTLDGKYLLYFAAYKKHIGIYPVPIGDADFNREISVYRAGKGTLQFPLNEPIPYGLITRIVQVRVKENAAKAAAKSKPR